MKLYRHNNPFLKANVSMTVDDEVLRVEWQNLNNREPTTGDVSLDFTQLKQKQGFADHTLWGLCEATQTWISVYPETITTKMTVGDLANVIKTNFLALLYVRLATDNLSDCVIRFNIADENTIDAGELLVDRSPCDTGLPGIQLGVPTFVNGIMEMPVSLLNSSGAPLSANATVYAESTVGALLTPRVSIVNGSGSIKVFVAGIEGQSGKVKIGFKFYNSVAERQFKV
jgi:hypothetical protein